MRCLSFILLSAVHLAAGFHVFPKLATSKSRSSILATRGKLAVVDVKTSFLSQSTNDENESSMSALLAYQEELRKRNSEVDTSPFASGPPSMGTISTQYDTNPSRWSANSSYSSREPSMDTKTLEQTSYSPEQRLPSTAAQSNPNQREFQRYEANPSDWSSVATGVSYNSKEATVDRDTQAFESAAYAPEQVSSSTPSEPTPKGDVLFSTDTSREQWSDAVGTPISTLPITDTALPNASFGDTQQVNSSPFEPESSAGSSLETTGVVHVQGYKDSSPAQPDPITTVGFPEYAQNESRVSFVQGQESAHTDESPSEVNHNAIDEGIATLDDSETASTPLSEPSQSFSLSPVSNWFKNLKGPFNFGDNKQKEMTANFAATENEVDEKAEESTTESLQGLESGKSEIPEAEVQAPLPRVDFDTTGMTERIIKRITLENEAAGAGGGSSWEAFKRTEVNWERLRNSTSFKYDATRLGQAVGDIRPPPQFVVEDGALGNPKCWEKLRRQGDSKSLDYDAVVCGGTLGIFFALSLLQKGYKVCVIEAGKLRGRNQEWNISMEELLELVKLGILSEEDVEAAVQTEFLGCRSGFKNKEVSPLSGGYFKNGIGFECLTPDVLNLGVSPEILLERAATQFEEMGGVVKDEMRLRSIALSEPIGAALDLGDEEEPISTRLVIDCMGNGSPISRQQRYGTKPDGICAVVGSCASGYDKATNVIGDIIYTFTNMVDKGEKGKLQYFWETFPVGIGRNGNEPGTSDVKTVYMFTYMDADKRRPSLESLMEDYWRLLPIYQPSISNPETDLNFRRVLFAYFPTYRESPLKPRWSRIIAVGDASGIQSPLSFGGFGALTRHLGRITGALNDALEYDLLHKDYLAEINAYTPNLSAAWMFQKAMSVRVGQKVDPEFVNRLLAVNFEIMDGMGQRTIKPFLQDVIRFDGLVGSLARAFVADPLFMPSIVFHVGLPTLSDWLGHVYMIGLYGFLDTIASPLVREYLEFVDEPRERYRWSRKIEAWKYGSGRDYKLPGSN